LAKEKAQGNAKQIIIKVLGWTRLKVRNF